MLISYKIYFKNRKQLPKRINKIAMQLATDNEMKAIVKDTTNGKK